MMMATPLVNMVTNTSSSVASTGKIPLTTTTTSLPQGKEEQEDTMNNPLLKCVLLDLERSEREGDRSQTVEAWNALGLIRLHTQRNASEALKCHQQALSLCTESMETSITCTDMGLCHERLGEDKEALRCYEKAYDLLEEDNVSESHPRRAGLKRVLARLGRM